VKYTYTDQVNSASKLWKDSSVTILLSLDCQKHNIRY